jgi:uncharacterized protein (TIGR02996 family)
MRLETVSMLSTREVLEAALVEDFDHLATHAAYADLLIEENDPRGEYIQLRLQLRDQSLPVKRRREVEQQASRILQEHERDWLGDLAPFLISRKRLDPEPGAPNYDYTFDLGWLRELDIYDVRHSFTRVLAGSPSVKLLHRLVLRNTRLRNNNHVLEPLLDSPYLQAVRVFQLGDDEGGQATTGGEHVAKLLERMPRLENLILLAEGVDAERLFQLPMPRLVKLQVDYLPSCPLHFLGRNESLRRLCHLRVSERDASFATTYEQIDDEAAALLFPPQHHLSVFFDSPFLAQLRELSLRIPAHGDAIASHLRSSEMLSRLHRLTLRNCDLTDNGAEILAGAPALRGLQALDVGANQLTPSGIDRLLETGVPLQYDSQAGTFPDWDEGGEVPF